MCPLRKDHIADTLVAQPTHILSDHAVGMAETQSPDTALAEPTWGAPAQPRAPWTHGHTLAAVGIALALAVGGGAVIYAATSGDRNQMEQDGRQMPGPGGPGPGNSLGDMAPPIHGEFVVADGAGGYRTEYLQHGEVTEVSDTSITTRSDDGFTQTYTLTPDTETRTPDGFAVGDTAIVRAVDQGGQLVATELTEGRRQP